jgi:hypothetical protein
MNADEIKALDHAWNWFSLHAAQRMQTFNFFLVAIAFLVAAYASLLDKSHWAAAFIAAAAAWLAFWFTRLEGRAQQLVEAGERVMAVCQTRLQTSSGLDLEIIRDVRQARHGAHTYACVIAVVQWSAFAMSIFGAAFAIFYRNN